MGSVISKVCNLCGQDKKLKNQIGPVTIYEPCTCEGSQAEIEAEKDKIKNDIIKKRMISIAGLIKKSLILPNEKSMSFDNFIVNDNNGEALDKCEKYVKNYKKYKKQGFGVFIIGGVGIGKTHLAISIGIGIMKKYLSRVLFVTAIDVSQKRVSWLDITGAELVILDDLGTEGTNEYSLELIYSFLDYRYRLMKPTLITTNLTSEELLERYKVRLMSRLSRNGMIKFKDEDHRLIKTR